MTLVQSFLLGMMVAWTPSLVFLGWCLRSHLQSRERRHVSADRPGAHWSRIPTDRIALDKTRLLPTHGRTPLTPASYRVDIRAGSHGISGICRRRF